MTRRLGLTFGLSALLVAALLWALPVAASHDEDDAHEDDHHHGTPAPGTPTPLTTSAAYLLITNTGDQPDRLLGGETAVAKVVEIHEIVEDERGVKQMRPLADGLEIPAGETVTLQPGGYHLMLIDLTEDLAPGQTFELTLTFAEAGEVTITVEVRARPQRPAEATPVAPVTVDGITITDAWARPALAMDHDLHEHMATPEADDRDEHQMATPAAAAS